MNQVVLSVLAGAAVATLAGSAAIAADDTQGPVDAIEYTETSDEELVSIIQDREQGWLNHPCEIGEPVMAELRKRHSDEASYARGFYLASALCADREERYHDGFLALQELETFLQNDFTNRLGFYFARRTGNETEIVRRFVAMSDAVIGNLDSDVVWSALRAVRNREQTDRLADLSLYWLNAGKFRLLDVELQRTFAIRALDAAARNGEVESVGEILSYLQSPSTYVSLLAERKYEIFWPQIEERAGENLERVSKEYAIWAQARFSNEPSDRDRFSEAARALHYAGEYDRVVELAQNWRKREGRGLAIEEGDGWALNLEAYAYDALGERKKADEVFDYLAALDPDEHPWVVNFVINRALRTVGHRKWAKGLDAADLARNVAEKYGSTYAKLLIAWSRSCALTKLGRSKEASADIEYLLDNKSESPEIVADALLCLDRRDDAADIMLEALRDEELRPRVLDSFQNEKFDLFYTPSELPKVVGLIDDYPELRAEALQYVRILPERFVPVAALKRRK